LNNLPATDRVVSELERLLQTLREYADTDELKRLNKLLRRTVPFSLRTYFNAFMLQTLLGTAPTADGNSAAAGSRGRRNRSRSRGETAARPETSTAGETPPRSDDALRSEAGSRGETSARTESAPRRKERLDEESESGGEGDDMRRLFVSIGRNRRVQASELTSLFASKVAIKDEDFGTIKILDNYSFVEVPGEIAQQAVDQLSGTTFKGRRITVDFARSRG
jgi:hypothetical protein